MPERFFDIETSSRAPQSLDARVQAYPGLRAKIETMLDVIENAGGDVEKAAVAEQRVIDAMRELGNDILHSWARRQQQKKEEELRAKPGVNRKEKKRSTGTRGSAKSNEWKPSSPRAAAGRRFGRFRHRRRWPVERARTRCNERSPILVRMIRLRARRPSCASTMGLRCR